MPFTRGLSHSLIATWTGVLVLVTLTSGTAAMEPEASPPALAAAGNTGTRADRASELLSQYEALRPGPAEDVGPLVMELATPLGGVSDALSVRVMPGSDFRPPEGGDFRKFTWVTRPFVLWGRIIGGSGSYSATWDPGDGSGPQPANVSDPNYVYLQHTYTTFGLKTAVLRVTDMTTSDVVSKNLLIDVDVATPVQETRYNASFEDGLRYLYLRQAANGLWSAAGGATTATALALSCFQLAGHAADNAPDEDVYADRVQSGLQAMVGRLGYYNLTSPQTCPVDLALPDGKGVVVTDAGGSSGYCQGMIMLGLALSQTPDVAASSGVLAGQTYRQILANMVDQLAYAQTDAGGGQGGWRYCANCASFGSSDNSIVQWAVIGLEAAAAPPWNIDAGPCLESELERWLNNSQCSDGSFGYTAPGVYCNNAKTGAGLYGHLYIDTAYGDSRVQSALNYLCSHWCALLDPYPWKEMFNGNFYALYSVKKALWDWEGRIVQPIRPCGTRDWQDEIEKNLVKGLTSVCGSDAYHQRTDTNDPINDGHWVEGQHLSSDLHLATTFALLTLLPGTICPPPVARIIIEPPGGCPGTQLGFDGTASTPSPNGTQIVEWRWDYFCDGTIDATGPQVHPSPELFPLPPGQSSATYCVCLTVVDDSPDSLCAFGTTQACFTIGTENHPPVAVPGGPYTACVGDTIRLDGCASYDPDAACTGDSIVEYCWDLDADGDFDYCTPTCLPDTFLIFYQEIEAAVRLSVEDTHGAVSDPASGIVRVWSSRKELSVAADDILLACVGPDSVAITVTIHAATQEPGIIVPAAEIELYADDPTCQDPARLVCQVQSIPMEDGEHFTFTCGWRLPDDASHEFTVCVDPDQSILECIETDNVASKTLEAGACEHLAMLVIHDDLVGYAGHPVVVPVYATTDSSIGIVQFVVGYNSDVVSFRGVDPGGDVPGFSVSHINPIPPFSPHCADADSNLLVQLSGSGAAYFSGVDEEIALLRFEVAGAPGDSTTLCFVRDPAGSFLTTENLHDIVDPELTFSDGFLRVECARYKLSGDVTYCGNRAVPLTLVTAKGVDSLFVKTDQQGRYSMTLCEGHYDVSCSKSNDRRHAIGGLDAALVLQHVAFLDTLEGCAFDAGDVTEDGFLRGSDALAIFQYAVDSTATAAHCGEWRFVPPLAGVDLGADTEQDFTTYLLGDANLSWSLDALVASKLGGRVSSEEATAIVVQETWDEDAGLLQIGLALRSPQAPVRSTLFTLRYDAESLRFVGWSRTTNETGVLALVREGGDGELRGGLASARPLSLDRDLILLDFEVRRQPIDLPWEFTRALVDDRPAVVAQSGRAPDDPTRVPPPVRFVLGQNHPNPFNATTAIRVGVPAGDLAGSVLQIFDAQGRVVRQLDLSKMPAGWHDVIWDGLSDRGRPVSSGVYFYAVRWRGSETARKMILIE